MPHPPFRASDHASDNKVHLLVAATGSVATIKLPQILSAFSSHPTISIRVLVTQSAAQFLQGQSAEQPSLDALSAIDNVDGVYTDADEWDPPWVRGSPILHIELRRWAEAMLIAPLSANSLAKMANGFSDSLILSVVRAWDTTGLVDGMRQGNRIPSPKSGRKQIYVAPAMNTAMWLQPITSRHMKVLQEEWKDWITVLAPAEKELACGDVGGGAMMEWKDIVATVKVGLGLRQDDTPT